MKISQQIEFDFSRVISPPNEKKMGSISFRAGETFKRRLEDSAREKGISVSDLCTEYAIKGLMADLRDSAFLELYADKPLRDVIKA